MYKRSPTPPHGRHRGTFRWHANGREVFRVEVTTGGPRVTWGTDWVADEDRLKAEMERAADWLKQFLPGLSHDQRYELLWGAGEGA